MVINQNLDIHDLIIFPLVSWLKFWVFPNNMRTQKAFVYFVDGNRKKMAKRQCLIMIYTCHSFGRSTMKVPFKCNGLQRIKCAQL